MVVCYAQPEKAKSRLVLEAFAAGCAGRMASTTARQLEPGGAAFYGVRPPWRHLWAQAKLERRTVYFLDNAWFDAGRERFFRVGVNAVQSWSPRPSDGKRLAALGVRVQPWRWDGRHIVVCPQSDEFMATVAGRPNWLAEVLREIATRTDRLVVVRKKGAPRPLRADLHGAWLLVAHSSAAAVEALLAGVPVIVTDPSCAMAAFGSSFSNLETGTRRPDGREEWAARLADSQFTLNEMRDGTAWRAYQGNDMDG